VLDAPVVFVGNNSTQRENASIITRIWVLPISSEVRGPMWSICRLSNGLQDAQVNGCVLMRIFSRLMTLQHGHWRMNWVIVRSMIVRSLRNSLHFYKPQWSTLELCTAAICLKKHRVCSLTCTVRTIHTAHCTYSTCSLFPSFRC